MFRTLHQRFREERLGLTAGSLTLTTLIALVPFFTVALALFTAFPMFAKLQDALQLWLVNSLVPDSIARQVLGYLTQFSRQASRLGSIGLVVLLFTTIAMVLTIDRTLNTIWRVPKTRPLAHRLLMVWAVLTLGPLLLAASIAALTFVLSVSAGWVGAVPDHVRMLLDILQFALLAAGLTVLFQLVPNTPVRWSHAAAGGILSASGIEIAKVLLVLYLLKVPAYSLIYGAFAVVPILLVWMYVIWLMVLAGAVIAACLPALLAPQTRIASGHGWHFQLAIEILQLLAQARTTIAKGYSVEQLAAALSVDTQQLAPALEALSQLDWIAQLDESPQQNQRFDQRPDVLHTPDSPSKSRVKNSADAEKSTKTASLPRYVLLVACESTLLEPLLQKLLLKPEKSLESLWQKSLLPTLTLHDALSKT